MKAEEDLLNGTVQPAKNDDHNYQTKYDDLEKVGVSGDADPPANGIPIIMEADQSRMKIDCNDGKRNADVDRIIKHDPSLSSDGDRMSKSNNLKTDGDCPKQLNCQPTQNGDCLGKWDKELKKNGDRQGLSYAEVVERNDDSFEAVAIEERDKEEQLAAWEKSSLVSPR